MNDISTYKEAMKVAVGAALDADLYYDADINSFVAQHCSVPDPAREVFLGIVDLPIHDLPASRKLYEETEAKVAMGARGTWAITRKVFHNDGQTRTVYSPLLSDGSGSLASGCSLDTSYVPPVFEHVLQRAFEMEVYLVRQELEKERLTANNLEAVESGRVAIGKEFRDVIVNSSKYSRAKVTAVDATTGYVNIELTKRGSRQRWKCVVGAAALSPAPAPGTANKAEEPSAPCP